MLETGQSLKQTFGRRKLCSTSPQNAAVELEWSLVGLWRLGLSAALKLAKAKVPPSRICMAEALRSFRRLMRDYPHPSMKGQTLRAKLRQSLIDTYERRSKASRNSPRTKKHEPTRAPKITDATSPQTKQAKMLKLFHRS